MDTLPDLLADIIKKPAHTWKEILEGHLYYSLKENRNQLSRRINRIIRQLHVEKKHQRRQIKLKHLKKMNKQKVRYETRKKRRHYLETRHTRKQENDYMFSCDFCIDSINTDSINTDSINTDSINTNSINTDLISAGLSKLGI